MTALRAVKIGGAVIALTGAALPLLIVGGLLYEAHEREEALRAAAGAR